METRFFYIVEACLFYIMEAYFSYVVNMAKDLDVTLDDPAGLRK